MQDWIKHISIEPVQIVYGTVAVFGGIARYLNSYTQGAPFQFTVLMASAFVSGFSGWMFATMGTSLTLPQGFVFMMAGTGGFFGDQTMKFILEWLKQRTN